MRVRNVRWVVIAIIVVLVLIGQSGSELQGQTATSWTEQDIGNPAIAGSATSSTSGFTIVAGGTDIGGYSDQFRFVYQPMTGDVDVRARVDSLTYTLAGAKAGVMIRGSLTPGAAHGFALVSAGSTAFDRRTQPDGSSAHTAGALVAAPQWVRLVRQGSIVSAYSSIDGAGWTLIGSDTIQLPTVVYVGLAVTSQDVSAATTASVSQIGVQLLGLPAGQQNSDVGSPVIAGTAIFANGVYTIHAGGADIWGTADQFHYVYQPVTGDVDVSVRIGAMTYAHQWSKAGVMIRETLSAGSAQAFALVSAGSGYAFHRRPVTGATSVGTAGGTGTAPGWLRLTRSGSLFTAYRSNDGTNWTPIGSDSIPMSDAVYVGIAATSHNVLVPTEVVADNLTVSQSTAPNQPPTATLTAPANGATYTAPATITLTATAADADGTVARVDFYDGTTLLGSDTTAPYAFTWSNVAAGTYAVRATAVDDADASGSSATATITVTAPANQIPTATLTSPANGASFTAPASLTLTASASDSDGTVARVDFYNGSTLLGTDASAPYAFTWSNVAAGTYTLKATAVDDDGAPGSSATATITVLAANQAPTATLTAPASGATFTAPASLTLTASASDSDGTVARVDFYNGSTLLGTDASAPYAFTWSNVAAGTYTLKATAVDDDGAPGSSATATITVSAANQAPTATLTAPASGATFTAPASITLTATASDSDGTVARVDFYNGSTLLGTDASAPYAFTWSNVAAGTYTLKATAVDDDGAPGSSATATITVSAANQAPTATLTAPASGATFTAPASLTLTASASDSDGTVARVDFYNGSTLLGTDASAPYAFTWSNVAAGTYALKATAVDDDGATGSSATATITVTAPANQAPTATLTAPATGATFTAPASITLTATASDADGTVARVDFYNGTTLLGSDTTAPYSFAWSNVAPGTYALKATAVDDDGATGSSATATITVSGAANGLVAAYGLNEGTGTTVTDNSGNGRMGAMSGASWVAGRYGQALSLNGTSSVVTVSDVDLPGSFTVMGWMQTRSLYSDTCGSLVMKAFDYGIEVCNGNLLARIGSGTGWNTYAMQALSTADLNVWKHVAMTYDGTTVRLYIDGGLVDSATGAHVSNNNTLLFGRWTPASEFWDGVVDEVRLYSRTLSQGEVQTDMAAPVSGGPGNQAPTASLTAPAPGATFTAPASVTLTATASDADGSVARVDFYNGTTLLGSDTTAPYSFTWSNVAAGTYALKATAVDDDGATGSSATATITVTAPANQAPTATLTAPATGATFTAPASITLTATASDADGTVARVDFYNGTTLLGSDTTAPYSFTWSNVAAGTYALKATAVDDDGATGSSATATITVTAPANQAPTATLTAPATGATFTAPASITLTATASDADGTVARVDFYNGTTLLGSDTTAPYSFAWSNVATGTYALKATAVDDDGATGSSATATITVSGAANGLVAAYGLNEGTGTTVTDNSGNGRMGAMSGASWVAGRYGQALSLNGASSVVTISDVDLPGSFTVMGWMQTRSLYSDTCGSFVMKAFDYGIEVCNGNLLARLGSGTGWNTYAMQALSTADLNVWKHVAMTYDGTTVRLYIDGGLVDSATGAHVSNNNTLLFGRWTPASEFWDGVVDEVRLYSRTLSQGEVQTDMAAPVSGGPGNQPPTASITSPANNATFTAPASIAMTANAADPENQLTKVEFYNGTTLLGTDTAAPYSFTWSAVPEATYSLTVRAYDAGGLSTTSAVVTVTVNTTTSSPTGVIFRASTDHAAVTTYRLDVFAAGADVNTATPVATMDAGKPAPDGNTDITVSAPAFFSALAAGSYQLTVSAIGAGGTGRSAPVPFTR